jgi:release factor glutamine methyltransferase
MTIMEALQWANNKLKKVGVDSPMLDAEIILAHILDVPKSWLFAHFSDPLKTHQAEQFNLLVARRLKHEPIAYIIKRKPFYGRDFFVDSSVLIPRPATETLITQALDHFNTLDPELSLITDTGTGSGAIAITLAKETKTPIIATDIDEHALSVATKNIESHEVSKQIDVQRGNLLEPIIKLFKTIRESGNSNVSSIYPFKNLIICANLPYLSTNQMDTLAKDTRYEPVGALVSGIDGLDAYFELFKQIKQNRDVLPRHVKVFIEIDSEQTKRAINMITHSFPESQPLVTKDLQNLDRIISVEL